MKGYVVCVYKNITNEEKLKEYASKARAAVENEFIEQAVASKASKQCDEFYSQYALKLNNLTLDKILEILGEEFFDKYKTEELDLE